MLKKNFSKLISLILIVICVSLLFTSTIFAENSIKKLDSDKEISNNAEKQIDAIGNGDIYQKIREKLSAEYGIEIRLATDEELKLVGLDSSVLQSRISTLSAAEYEAELRKSVEQEIEITKEALSKTVAAGISESDYMPVLSPQENITTGIIDVTAQKAITGAIAILNGTINTSLSYPYWSSVYRAYTLTGSLHATPPFFVSETWGYKQLDAKRTVAVTFNGYTIDLYGNYLGTASRYVEFYASSYV